MTVQNAYDAAVPTAGYYRMRLVRGGIFVAVRIWHGPPHDPVTGDEMDRGWRWQATCNGKYIDLDRVWPKCGWEPIDEAEHDYLSRLQSWATKHAPSSPQADPTRRIDLLSAPINL